jgi:hypothetical protein
MYKRAFTISALALGMAAAASSVTQAQAQMACGARDAVVAKLGEKYGEVRRGGGLAGATAIFEIWASEATGTWTILKSMPNGQSCVMAVGEGWQDDDGTATPVGSPV